jgi:Trypsin-co-occurring domain 1
MGLTKIVEVAMPDGTVINAEVTVADQVTDVGVQSRFHLPEAKETINSFVHWVLASLSTSTDEVTEGMEARSPLGGMALTRVGVEFGLKLAVKNGALTSVIAVAGGEATAVVRMEWERHSGGGTSGDA